MERWKRIVKIFVVTFISVIVLICYIGVVYESQGVESLEAGAGWFLVYRYTKKESGFIMDFGLGVFAIIAIITYALNIFIVRYYPGSVFSRLLEKDDKGSNENKKSKNKVIESKGSKDEIIESKDNKNKSNKAV